MASRRRVGERPDCHTFCKFWHFQMAVSQWKLAWLTPNLGILWISVSSFWLCESIVANRIIYRLVPRPSRFETRQCSFNRLKMERNSFKEYSVLATVSKEEQRPIRACYNFFHLDRVIAWLDEVATVAHNNTSRRLGKKIPELLPQS